MPSLRKSTNSVGRPSFGTVAKASTTGVCGTSLPRMLNSHETACGSETISVSAASFCISARSARELARRVFAGIAQIVRHDRAERRLRPVGPDRIDRIVFDRHEVGARGGAGFGEPFGAVDGVQPGRIAELGAGRHIGFDPGRRRLLDQMRDGKERAVHFLAHLHLIAAVDEQHGAVGEHDRDAGRAGEAGEPGQPLGAGRHVFVLIAVGARHDEAVEPAELQLRAQCRQARRAVAAVAAIVE